MQNSTGYYLHKQQQMLKKKSEHGIPTILTHPPIPAFMNFWPVKQYNFLARCKKQQKKYSDLADYVEQQGGGGPIFPPFLPPLLPQQQQQQQLAIEAPSLPPPPFNPVYVANEQYGSLTKRSSCMFSTGYVELIIGVVFLKWRVKKMNF